MTPLRVEQYVVGSVQTNCYFAINDDTKEMLIIDPGASADRLAELIEEAPEDYKAKLKMLKPGECWITK